NGNGNGGGNGMPGDGGNDKLVFRGVWTPGHSYTKGDMVTYDKGTWIYNYPSASLAKLPTETEIGNEPKNGSVYWFLLVATGDDGKDGTNDGKGYEIIFKATDDDGGVPTPVAPVNDPSLDDNYPDDWSD